MPDVSQHTRFCFYSLSYKEPQVSSEVPQSFCYEEDIYVFISTRHEEDKIIIKKIRKIQNGRKWLSRTEVGKFWPSPCFSK